MEVIVVGPGVDIVELAGVVIGSGYDLVGVIRVFTWHVTGCF